MVKKCVTCEALLRTVLNSIRTVFLFSTKWLYRGENSMTVAEIREYYSKDERGLEELVRSLIERKVISPSVAKKYFGVEED